MTDNKNLPKKTTDLPAPQDEIGSYLNKISHLPILSNDEEKALAYDWYDNKNQESAKKLILHHLRFVAYIARNYRGYGLPIPDLIQEGTVGLMKAVKSFDPNKGVRLASFAVHWIRSEINEYVIRNWKIVKIATTKEQRKLFFNLRSKKKGLEWLGDKEAEQIAKDLNVSKAQVLEMENRLTSQDTHFDEPAKADEDKNFLAPSVYLAADEYSDPAKQLEEEEIEEKGKKALYYALSTLDERSQDILKRRWLTDQRKATLGELAEEYGISAERVRQIENNAMRKLRGLIVF